MDHSFNWKMYNYRIEKKMKRSIFENPKQKHSHQKNVINKLDFIKIKVFSLQKTL